MPREIITVQCGQCGNQVGCRFWEMALQEHAAFNTTGIFDFPLSSFFRNVDNRYDPPVELPVRDGTSKIRSLEARAVLVDMEEGVLNQLLKGPLSSLFKSKQCIADVSGSGNNWAHGHDVYGRQYGETIVEMLQTEAEKCDSLQGFLMLHSLGGGTGSGLGSYIMELLYDNFRESLRISAPVFPSETDDVVTSPYNSLLSMGSLIETADFVTTIENQALCDILDIIETQKAKNPNPTIPPSKSMKSKRQPQRRAFDNLNGIIANLLLHLTCSVRFEGSLNVDLNDLSANLVPFPRMHFLVPSLSPIYTVSLKNPRDPLSGINQLFADAVSHKTQLMKVNPLNSTYMAGAFLMRGSQVNISDLSHNMSLIKQKMNMVHWNPDGFKFGLCHRPPLNAPYSLMCLANNTCIQNQFKDMRSRFEKLYKKRVYVHHYTQYMEPSMFQTALAKLDDLIDDYGTQDCSDASEE